MGNVSVPVLSFSGIIVFWNVYFLFLWDATKCAFQLTSSNTELGAWEMYHLVQILVLAVGFYTASLLMVITVYVNLSQCVSALNLFITLNLLEECNSDFLWYKKEEY